MKKDGCPFESSEISFDEENDLYSFVCPFCGSTNVINDLKLCEHVVYVRAVGSDESFGLSDTFLELMDHLLEHGKAAAPSRLQSYYRDCMKFKAQETVRSADEREERLSACADYLYSLEELSMAEAADIIAQAGLHELKEKMRLFCTDCGTESEMAFLLYAEGNEGLRELLSRQCPNAGLRELLSRQCPNAG